MSERERETERVCEREIGSKRERVEECVSVQTQIDDIQQINHKS